MSLKDLWKMWQEFWFKPQSPLSLGLFRVCFGVVFLTQVLSQYGRDFFVFFGSHAILTHANFVANWQYKDLLVNVFDFIPIKNSWHLAVFVVLAIASLMMTIGLFTRVSTFVVYILYSSISNQFPFMLNAGDDMQRLVVLLLLFSRAGDAVSLDCILQQPRKNWYRACFMPPPSAPWGQRMLQLQVSLAYVSTALLKINSDVWFAGNGVNYSTSLADFGKFSLPVLFDHRFSLYMFNWMTIVTEFSLGILLWVREFTNWILLAGRLISLGY